MTGVLTRRRKATRNACGQRKGHVRTQQEGSCTQGKERGLLRGQPCPHPDLGLLAPGTLRKLISVALAT